MFANFPSSFSRSPSFGLVPSCFYLWPLTPPPSLHLHLSLFVYCKPTLPFSLLLFSSSPSLPPSLHPPTPIPYRWRLTWECSAIRPPDCLLLRRWMEAPSASLTQPQLHRPPWWMEGRERGVRREEGHLSQPLIYLSLQGLGWGRGGREVGFTLTVGRHFISVLQPELVFPPFWDPNH